LNRSCAFIFCKKEVGKKSDGNACKGGFYALDCERS